MDAANPTAALLVIGDEILTGETQDSNSAFLCRELTARGVGVVRIVTVPDEQQAIMDELARLRALGVDFVLTTGGIGPTPDDLTRQSVALALGQELVLHQTVVSRYEELSSQPLNAAQLGMCRLPADAEPILVGTSGAPGFKLDGVYVLPGVPSILRDMWKEIAGDFHGQPLHVETFTASRRESDFAELMQQYVASYPELKFGSYPRLLGERWQVELRVRGRNRELVQEAARKFMDEMGGMPE